jgi:hypothetical protein
MWCPDAAENGIGWPISLVSAGVVANMYRLAKKVALLF